MGTTSTCMRPCDPPISAHTGASIGSVSGRATARMTGTVRLRPVEGLMMPYLVTTTVSVDPDAIDGLAALLMRRAATWSLLIVIGLVPRSRRIAPRGRSG